MEKIKAFLKRWRKHCKKQLYCERCDLYGACPMCGELHIASELTQDMIDRFVETVEETEGKDD